MPQSSYPSLKEWQQRKDHSPVRIQWDPERDLLLQPLDIERYKSD